MSAPFTFLNFAMEDVLKSYIEQNDLLTPPLNVYRTCEAIADGQKMIEPLVTISCSESGPVPELNIDASSGVQNQMLVCVLLVRTHASNEQINGEQPIDQSIAGRAFHARTVGRIMDLLYDSGLVDSLNNIGILGIGINQVNTPRASTVPADRSYVTKVSFDVHAFPKLE